MERSGAAGDLSRRDLNQLYAASMAFGANWRKPIDELALERFGPATHEHLTYVGSVGREGAERERRQLVRVR